MASLREESNIQLPANDLMEINAKIACQLLLNFRIKLLQAGGNKGPQANKDTKIHNASQKRKHTMLTIHFWLAHK